MTKKIKKVLLIVAGGMLGGIIVELLSPLLGAVPFIYRIGFLQRAFDGTTIVNPVQKITITENQAVENAVGRANSFLVAVSAEKSPSYKKKATTPKKVFGSGLILTSDGQILVSADLVFDGYDNYVVIGENKLLAKLLKVDAQNKLATLKVAESNLTAVPLVDETDIRLGADAIVVSWQSIEKINNLIVQESIISLISGDKIYAFMPSEILPGDYITINDKGNVISFDKIEKGGLLLLNGSKNIKSMLVQ
ncbi:MAG: hypothetical protein COU81_02130 [Candidatus Portnoybacteria bacterium CG10_big_fil_rev_8_21_14_0_10_36_7]|uniref:Uncharacterized protein n=1 Tax=Candidatus Portnoybacteria bacterium CG10_big_fil_rev_8_21_14_0_10_36_7 TaxID=1974812 RepID=A0A2M8KE42_9BACT|nr:MAG: hypothetical protein COU81_02130 [Candidatus Portnoybacteria bacterium CG10_big_fil_rev_8_21_14_0_10_36_7]